MEINGKAITKFNRTRISLCKSASVQWYMNHRASDKYFIWRCEFLLLKANIWNGHLRISQVLQTSFYGSDWTKLKWELFFFLGQYLSHTRNVLEIKYLICVLLLLVRSLCHVNCILGDTLFTGSKRLWRVEKERRPCISSGSETHTQQPWSQSSSVLYPLRKADEAQVVAVMFPVLKQVCTEKQSNDSHFRCQMAPALLTS